ncbi:MAG: HD domain-containing phosphohydrolase [Nitrospinales bacterium]
MDDTKKKLTAKAKVAVKLSEDENLDSLLKNVVSEVTTFSERLTAQIRRLSDIGRALSGQRNLNALLEMIVTEARQFTTADAGTLYIKEGNTLRFKILQNESLQTYMGGKSGEEIPFPPVELKESNVSAYVAMKGISVNIPDVYNSDLFDFTGPKKFDESTGYRSKSMLVVPMRNHEDDVIGVLQLLNAKNSKGKVISFSPDYEELTESLASQAAVAITNVSLINDMERLFESFVEVMATAIDEKSPVTGGHIRRVAGLTMEMADVINEQKSGRFGKIKFNPDQLYELKIAALMHDIGKVTTPVDVVEKAKKLQTIFDRVHLVDMRFKYLIMREKHLSAQRKIKLLEQGASPESMKNWEEESKPKIEELKEIRQFILECNNPSEFLEDEKIERLQAISRLTYTDEDGKEVRYLDDDELENLSIRRGSITEKERKIMQNHAAVTLKMLEKIPFTKKLKNIPNFAGAHHEFINGKGYPLGLKGDEIPFEGLLMAVTDIAEALTASDRPYKKAMPLAVVYKILRAMAKNMELDSDLVELFISENVYERYMAKKKAEEGNGGSAHSSETTREQADSTNVAKAVKTT